MVSELERRITFRAAFDKRTDDPKTNYGIHGVEMRWLLVGPLGAIQFMLYTNWHLPNVVKEQQQRTIDSIRAHEYDDYPAVYFTTQAPLPADLGYHSPKALYEDQEPMPGECDVIEGGTCYYDGSGLAAREVFELLVREGGDAVWELMEKEYADRFKEES